MRLVTVSEAAAALHTSERTIWRRVRAGQLRKVREGDRTLVEVDVADPLTAVSDASGKLSDAVQANAILRAQDVDVLTIVVDELRHQRKVSRAGSVMAVAASVAMLAVTAWLAVQYHSATLEHVGQVDSLEREVERGLRRTTAAVGDLLEAGRERDTLRLEVDRLRLEVAAGYRVRSAAPPLARQDMLSLVQSW